VIEVNMPTLDDASFAIIPQSALSLLAPLRDVAGVTVALDASTARVAFPAGQRAVLERLLCAPRVELFSRRENAWYRALESLPAFDLDTRGNFVPLARALTPARIESELAPPLKPAPVRLSLTRSEKPRDVTAALYALPALAAWADMASARVIESFRAARQGERVLLMGANPPWIEPGQRYWSERVLCPLGYELTPDVPESAICEALGLREGDVVIVGENGGESIPASAFALLTRAGLRVAEQELEPRPS
jgi:MoxR-vWA-beta-propeller ternary system domain bpX2